VARRDANTPAPPPDPYEHGFEAVQRQRLELPPISPEGQAIKQPPRISWKWLVGGLAVVVAIGLGRGVTANNSSSLTADCTHDRVAVADKSITSKGSEVLHWSATAGHGARLAVGLNAATVTLDSTGQPMATPAGAGGSQVSRLQTIGTECLARGVFGVLLAPGTYSVTLFTFTGDSATPVASTRLRVTAQ
jgi:hypothetical protein